MADVINRGRGTGRVDGRIVRGARRAVGRDL